MPAREPVYEQPAVVTPSVAGSVRMGFGIAAGFVLFMIVVGVIAILIFGVATSQITWPFAKPALVFAGTGPGDSSAMKLGGTYTIEWTGAPTTGDSCWISAALRSQAEPIGRPLVEAFASQRLQPLPINGLVLPSRNDYVVHVESDCSWSFRFVEE
jgi:hypothetical protein